MDSFEQLLGISDKVVCECGSPMRYVAIRRFYGCVRWPDCRGSIGAHPDGTPMGIPTTDEALKIARREGHFVLDSFRGMTRNRRYYMLQKLLKMTREECHFGLFDLDTCLRAINLLRAEYLRIHGKTLGPFNPAA